MWVHVLGLCTFAMLCFNFVLNSPCFAFTQARRFHPVQAMMITIVGTRAETLCQWAEPQLIALQFWASLLEPCFTLLSLSYWTFDMLIHASGIVSGHRQLNDDNNTLTPNPRLHSMEPMRSIKLSLSAHHNNLEFGQCLFQSFSCAYQEKWPWWHTRLRTRVSEDQQWLVINNFLAVVLSCC